MKFYGHSLERLHEDSYMLILDGGTLMVHLLRSKGGPDKGRWTSIITPSKIDMRFTWLLKVIAERQSSKQHQLGVTRHTREDSLAALEQRTREFVSDLKGLSAEYLTTLCKESLEPKMVEGQLYRPHPLTARAYQTTLDRGVENERDALIAALERTMLGPLPLTAIGGSA